ncbi:capsid protein [Streptococcus pneumoniae]|nr:capsid protein [Streptococcus pneumoniae]
MGTDVTIKIDLKGLEKKVSPQSFQRGQIAMTSQILMDMNKYVPYQSHMLRVSGHASRDKIVWATPYARIVFFGRKRKGFFSDKQRRFFFANKDELLKHKPKPGTGPRWDKKAIPKHSKEWGKVAIRAMGITK